MLSPTILIDELAPMMGLTIGQLKRKHRQMHESHGFPFTLPGSRWAWSRSAVSLWMEAGAMPVVVHPANDNPTVVSTTRISALIQSQRTALNERYGGPR